MTFIFRGDDGGTERSKPAIESPTLALSPPRAPPLKFSTTRLFCFLSLSCATRACRPPPENIPVANNELPFQLLQEFSEKVHEVARASLDEVVDDFLRTNGIVADHRMTFMERTSLRSECRRLTQFLRLVDFVVVDTLRDLVRLLGRANDDTGGTIATTNQQYVRRLWQLTAGLPFQALAPLRWHLYPSPPRQELNP